MRWLIPDGPEAELFWATVGGNADHRHHPRATIEMTPTETAYFIADGDVTNTLDETIAFHSDGTEDNYTYSSAWFARHQRAARWAGPRSPGDRWAASHQPPKPQTRQFGCAATAHAARRPNGSREQ